MKHLQVLEEQWQQLGQRVTVTSSPEIHLGYSKGEQKTISIILN